MNEEEVNLLENRKIELLLIKDSLEDLKEGKEIYVPLGAGVYIKSTIKGMKKLLVNVGGNIFLEKTPEEIKEMINKQIEEIDKLLK